MGEPPADVLRSFGVSDRIPVRIGSGEGRSWHAGDVVLKPCDFAQEWTWLARTLPTVPQDGFRLALPRASADGRWVVDGWCAQGWVEGADPQVARWLDVLEVGRRFHRALASVPRPDFIDVRENVWSVGDRVAWGEADPPSGHASLGLLLSLRRPVDLPSQLIHGDLTENVLFADERGMQPAVIDVTPYWRPAGFASAIVVADAVRWKDADPDPLVAAVSSIECFPQLFVRAVIYRLVTTIVSGRERDVPRYEGVVRLAEGLAGS